MECSWELLVNMDPELFHKAAIGGPAGSFKIVPFYRTVIGDKAGSKAIVHFAIPPFSLPFPKRQI